MVLWVFNKLFILVSWMWMSCKREIFSVGVCFLGAWGQGWWRSVCCWRGRSHVGCSPVSPSTAGTGGSTSPPPSRLSWVCILMCLILNLWVFCLIQFKRLQVTRAVQITTVTTKQLKIQLQLLVCVLILHSKFEKHWRRVEFRGSE